MNTLLWNTSLAVYKAQPHTVQKYLTICLPTIHLYRGLKKVMNEMEKDFLDGLLDILEQFFIKFTATVQQPELIAAVQQPEFTAKVQPTYVTSGKRPHEALADVDANVEIPPKQVKKTRAKKQAKVSPESTRDIIAIAEFEEQQNTTITKEMRYNIKLVVRTMQRMEQTISNQQNKVEEMSKHQTRMVKALDTEAIFGDGTLK